MQGEYSGGCLCGAVTFGVTGAFQSFFLCHCSRCRRGTGSAHGANLFSTTARLDWRSGEDRVRGFSLPGTRHERSFCADCGAALPRVSADGALLVVPAGSLDDAIDIAPTARICMASRAAWTVGLENVPAFDGLPG